MVMTVCIYHIEISEMPSEMTAFTGFPIKGPIREKGESMNDIQLKRWAVYYRKEPTFVVDPNLTVEDLPKTHQYLVTVLAKTKDQVYEMMQAENWSPNGEQRAVITALHLRHTSMSVGDVLVFGFPSITGRTLAIQCAPFGWKIVPQFRKPIVRNLGAIVGAFQIIRKSEEAYTNLAYSLGYTPRSIKVMLDLIHKHHEGRRNNAVKKVKQVTGQTFDEIGKEVCRRTSGKWVYNHLNW